MGLLHRLRAGAAQLIAGYEPVPRWARITHVGAKVGPVVSIELEVHDGDTPPHVVSTFAIPPHGVTLQVGQDWAVRAELDSRDAADYSIEFDKPVRHGSAPREAGLEPAAPPRQAVHPVRSIAQARRAMDAGRITREEFDQARQALMNWRPRR